MDEELRRAVSDAVEPYRNGSRILNVAAVVDQLAVDFPGADKAVIADLVRRRAANLGVTILFKAPR
jgi:hypothetical protein